MANLITDLWFGRVKEIRSILIKAYRLISQIHTNIFIMQLSKYLISNGITRQEIKIDPSDK